MPKVKHPKRISVRITAKEDWNLNQFCKSRRIKKSQLLQRLLDRVSADVEIKQPKEAFKPKPAPSPVIASNARVISNLNVLLDSSRSNYRLAADLPDMLRTIQHQLRQRQLPPHFFRELESVLQSVQQTAQSNVDCDHRIYKCLQIIEKELSIK